MQRLVSLHLGRNCSEMLRLIFAMGKFGGLYACGATLAHTMPLPNIFLTLLFSKPRLKRKDFQEVARLAWAQEVRGSNPRAPTKLPKRIIELPSCPFPACCIVVQVGNSWEQNLTQSCDRIAFGLGNRMSVNVHRCCRARMSQ